MFTYRSYDAGILKFVNVLGSLAGQHRTRGPNICLLFVISALGVNLGLRADVVSLWIG